MIMEHYGYCLYCESTQTLLFPSTVFAGYYECENCRSDIIKTETGWAGILRNKKIVESDSREFVVNHLSLQSKNRKVV